MKKFLKRLLKAAISVAIIAALVAFRKVDKDLPWEQVITVKFLILAAIHIIPAYVIVWALGDDNDLFLAESFAIFMPILIIWYALLGIVWAIFHFWLHLF